MSRSGSSVLDPGGAVPEAIVQTLRSLITRVRRIVLVRGLLAVGAVGIVAIMSIMGVDAAMTIFSPTTRWLLTLAGLGITAAVAYFFLVRPLTRSFTLSGVARMLETRHPELEERVSSAVELLMSKDDPSLRGSEALIAEVVRGAIADVRVVRPELEFSARKVRPYFTAMSVAAAVLVALMIVWPRQTQRLFTRAVAPYADIGNVQAFDLEVTPGDAVRIHGEALTIAVTVRGKALSGASVRLLSETDVETIAEMQQDSEAGGARFTYAIPALQASFRYRVTAGQALSEYYEVDVVPRPAVEVIDLQYKYPAYTGQAPKNESGADGDIACLPGTEVTITAHVNTDLASAHLLLNGNPVRGTRADTEPKRHSWTWPVTIKAKASGEWWLHLEDKHGFRSTSPRHKLVALADQRPSVNVTSPAFRQPKLQPTDRLPIEYVARDDHGIRMVDLLLSANGAEPEVIGAPMPAASKVEEGTWTGRASLDLAAFDLGTAKRATFQVRVLDILPPELGGPQSARSEPITIIFDKRAASYVDQSVGSAEAGILSDLDKVIKELQAARTQSVGLEKLVANDKPLPPAVVSRAEAVRKHAAKADAQLRDLAEGIEETDFAALAKPVTDVADQHAAPARHEAEMIRLAEKGTERSAHTTAARKHIDQGIAAVKGLRARAKKLARQIRLAKKLDNMAQTERKLAEALVAMKDSELGEDWRKLQEDMAEKIADIIKAESEKSGPEPKVPHAPDKLAKDSNELEWQQRELAELTERQDANDPKERDVEADLLRLIASEERSVARAAERLAATPGKKPAGQDANLTKGAKEAKGTARKLESRDIKKALAAALRAQDALRKAANRPSGSRPPSAGGQPESQAEPLAKRQENVVQAIKRTRSRGCRRTSPSEPKTWQRKPRSFRSKSRPNNEHVKPSRTCSWPHKRPRKPKS